MLFPTSQFSIGAAPQAVSAQSRSGFRQKRGESRLGVCPLRSQRVQAPGDFNRDAAWTRGVSEDRYCLDKISDCLSRFGIPGIDSVGQSALKLDDEVTGDTRPGAIIEARSHDDLTNTRDRPAFSRAFRGFVQAEIIDDREGKQRQGKPVDGRLPFVPEKFVGVHFVAFPCLRHWQRGRRLSGSGAPECDCARDGSGPAPHGAPVIATLNDPLTVFVAHNFPHVMAPHHDDTDRRTARV